ncbi:F-box only protein 7 isoform 2-T3 [Odontesthes bonariensis]|uniref:F-box only protein 7 isoform X2 n=1 Tax=Odontesthes bonariensis TaxID=219752 RepID=UPI003F581E8B
MKLRVRINQQTSKVELPSEEPSVTQLRELIEETLLSSHGLSSDTQFSLSLGGSELLSDSDQTLASCGVVSGDLICVLLPPAAATSATSATSNPTTTTRTTSNPTTTTRTTSNPTTTRTTSNPTTTRTTSNPTTTRTTSNPTTTTTRTTHSQQMNSGTTSQPSSPPLTPPTQTCDMQGSAPAALVWEPMLCSEAEEGQAPLSLDLLYHTARIASPNDAVMVAAHLLMLETGFTSLGCEVKQGEMPAGWRSAGGVYRLQYAHPLSGSSLAAVVAVSMGPLLVINATLKVTETVDAVRKLQLNACSYVTDDWPGESAAAAFKDLKKMSRIFKDQLAYPLIAAAREAMNLPVAFGLPALPPELLLRVLRLLDVQSLARLSAGSRHFHAAAADSTLWRHLYRRDFADQDRSRSRDTDWKELYRKTHQSRSESRRAIRHRSLPPFPDRDIFTPMPRPLFPPLPGIIGGEYDQRPNFPHGLLPRPRYDPIGPIADPAGRPRSGYRRPAGGRPADIRRGFI